VTLIGIWSKQSGKNHCHRAQIRLKWWKEEAPKFPLLAGFGNEHRIRACVLSGRSCSKSYADEVERCSSE
jgi:hypothetical protein